MYIDDQLIERIPQDIKTLIYNDYFHPRLRFIYMFQIITDSLKNNIHPKEIIQYVRDLLTIDTDLFTYVVGGGGVSTCKVVKKQFVNSLWISVMFLSTKINVHFLV
jgi:hypothetical protein